mgnify:CR=1 FL=1
MNIILLSSTVGQINQMIVWGTGLVAALLIIRLMRDLFAAYDDADAGLKEVFKKMKKRILACIIAVTVTGFVAWIKSYYS